MKYFQFSLLDSETGISVLRQPQGKAGIKYPDIDGLQILFQDARMPEWYYGSASDNAVAGPPEEENLEITEAEYKERIKDSIRIIIQQRLDEVVQKEVETRQDVLSKYHISAIVAGGYKYEQALAYLADNNTSVPELEKEATIRGITITELANKIKSHHENYKLADAKIAGIRGMIQKRLNDFVINENDPWSSYNDLLGRMEKIGEETIPEFRKQLIEQLGTNVRDVNVYYYGTDITSRYYSPYYE